ncbi:MAG TPA: thiamine pyrophosphate-dependent enzyme, partial [Geobacteraceae bacterium]
MPVKVMESPQTPYVSILNEQGIVVDDANLPAFSRQETAKLYELLVLSRTFDERALSLQREGRIGTYPSILGQEATQVGSALALEEE